MFGIDYSIVRGWCSERNGDVVGKKRCVVIILGRNVIYLKRDGAVKCG